MKRMTPPIAVGDTYEKVRPRLLKSAEFQAVTSEDSRRAAFDKHVRRLREKEEEAGRSHRRRDRSVERDRRERDRSRGDRPHRSTGGRSSRRSRSPEVDPYEADRRRAIAERERNHRKATMAENVLSTDRGRLSPPRRERERERDRDRDRERERELDRPPRPRRDEDSHYDRERRDRDDERERLYRRRIDRGSYDELPYGDERPSGARRRRADEDDDYARRESRDSKVCPRPPTLPPRFRRAMRLTSYTESQEGHFQRAFRGT